MNLDARIMNIPRPEEGGSLTGDESPAQAYALGHRDARHAAAELAAEREAGYCEVIADLTRELEDLIHWLEQGDHDPSFLADAKKAIERAQTTEAKHHESG